MKRTGVSRKSKVSVGHRYGPTASSSTILGPARREERLAHARASRAVEISEMSFKQRQDLIDTQRCSDNDSNHEMDIDNPFFQPPVGEEGAHHSNAGEDREVMMDMQDELCKKVLRRPKDTRTRQNRVSTGQKYWNLQLPRLVDSYLMWQHEPWQPSHSAEPLHAGPRVVPEYDLPPFPDDEDPIVSDRAPGQGNFAMEGVDTFDHNIYNFRRPDDMTYTNEGLIRGGFIGGAPLYPSIAISIRTLEDHRQTHRVCPHLSIQATVRKLCHVHNRPFHRYLCRQFSEAFDVYLEILHRVDMKVAKALGRDSQDWHLRNACPCCMYELEGEEPLAHRILATMDGNNSLKLVDDSFRRGTQRIDARTGRADFWLSEEYVDQFKDEVSNHGKRGGMGLPDEGDDDDAAWLDVEAQEQDNGQFKRAPADMDNPVPNVPSNPCTERWKNAGPDGQKKMFSMFLITGVFLCLCRHGMLLLLCDMIQSGELAKYPLAIVSKVLEVLGDNNTIGYDIGCAFEQTVSSSSLGIRAAAQHLKFVVPSFHGHAHNRRCQLHYHPQYITTLGIEDFETCERCFAISNGLAANTRLATRFHRQQAIEQHFQFQDQDKYAELSTFIVNNYKQSLAIISTNSIALATVCSDLNLNNGDFETYLDKERTYLASLKEERLDNTLHLDYVKALDHLQTMRAEEQVAAAQNTPIARDRGILAGETSKDLTRRARNHTTAFNRTVRAEEQLVRLEQLLDIVDRWTADSADYIRVTEFIKHRKYLRAVDNLERLVVQRLFELTKMNHSGTGYKLRTQIAKALKNRSNTIRSALDLYNRLAKTLDPPRLNLDFKEVLEYSSLAEFDLLRDTRGTVQSQVWAQPAYRAAMSLYFKMKCARAEIKRLDMEIIHLRTFIRDDEVSYSQSIHTTKSSDPGLAAVLTHQLKLRHEVNHIHLARLAALSDIAGYTGSQNCGVRKGHAATDLVFSLTGQMVHAAVALDEDEDLSDNEVLQAEYNAVTDFIANAQ